MSEKMHALIWNYRMSSMIFLMCIFGGLGIDRDFRLRRKKPQTVKINSRIKKFFFFRAKKTRIYFPILALILESYGYIQLVAFSIVNCVTYFVYTQGLVSLGDIISTVQIGVVVLIVLVGGCIMWIQREFEE